MDAGVFVSRYEAESTSFAKALEMYAEQVTSKKRSSDSELSRVQALQRHPLAIRSLASIRGADSQLPRSTPCRGAGSSHSTP